MESLFRDLPETDVYIDDVGVFSNSWKDHLQSLTKVLSVLQQANFTVNPLKWSGDSKKLTGLDTG